jgi:hypothetical protein
MDTEERRDGDKNMKGIKETKKEIILSVIIDVSYASNSITGRKAQVPL